MKTKQPITAHAKSTPNPQSMKASAVESTPNNPQPITVSVESTPNPQSMKFTVNQKISTQNWETTDIKYAQRSPLAQKILGFPWASKVFIGSHFITISKEDWVEWEVLTQPLSQMIQEHITNKEIILHPLQSTQTKLNNSSAATNTDSKIVTQIKHFLKVKIQPIVARDGGFISFADYKEGTVFLKMQGACSGCPSAAVTLKQGIETILKKEIPEVKSVVAV